MAINALKKLFQGDQPLAASAITKEELKYKSNVFSLIGNGTTNSVTATVALTAGAQPIGLYVTKQTSHANSPVCTFGANSVKVSVANALVGTDVCEGVIITIEP